MPPPQSSSTVSQYDLRQLTESPEYKKRFNADSKSDSKS